MIIGNKPQPRIGVDGHCSWRERDVSLAYRGGEGSGTGARLPALDGLRGLLAIVVLVDHALMRVGSNAFSVAANAAVMVFFMMSGLVLTRAWEGNLAMFLGRRFVRLWPAFAISLAAGGLLEGRAPAALEFIWIPYPRYDANVLCPPLWSLFIEAWMCPLMPAIAWSARGGLWRTLGSMGFCIFVAGVWWPERLELRALSWYSACFVAGAGFSRVTWRSGFLERPVPQWLGRISYCLYLTHWLVIEAVAGVFGTAGILVVVPGCFLVAHFMWRCVDRPSIRLSRRLFVARR